MKASVRVLDFNMKELFSQEKAVDVDADGVQKRIMQIPEVRSDATPTVYFVQLNLKNATGKVVSSNFYWLSTETPVCDWERSNPAVTTPITCHEDMTRLANLPKASLKATAYLQPAKGGPSVQVRLKNTSAALAFQVRLAVESRPASEEVVPVLWEDNYISLLPGEERTVEARFPGKRSIGSHPVLKVTGWNIEPETLAIRKTGTRLKKT
jgi:exo-1,4-beta-D-glucosaminidase